MAHTPAPWRVNGLLIEIANGMAAEIATVRNAGVGCAPRTTEQAKANAHLIAAAPDLLAACEAVLGYWESDPSGFAECAPGCTCVVDQARAAIAKAKGA